MQWGDETWDENKERNYMEMKWKGAEKLTMCGAAWMPTDLFILMGATYCPFLA